MTYNREMRGFPCVIVIVILAVAPTMTYAAERIMVSFSNLAYPFFVYMQRVAEDEAQKLGVKLIIQDGQGNSPKQSADVEVALVQGVDAILIAPNDVSALVPAVNEVLKEGVPIMTLDRRVDHPVRPVHHVGVDNVAGGRAMAKWIIDNYPDGATLVHLTGQPGSSTAQDRARGTREGLAKGGKKKYRILADQTANWSRAESLTVTKSILTALEEPPDLIIGSCDDMAFGAIEAIDSVGLKDAGIRVIGYDALPEALSKVRDGVLSATVEQEPGLQVRTALRVMTEHLRTGKPLRTVIVKPFVIEKHNVDKAERIGEVKEKDEKGKRKGNKKKGDSTAMLDRSLWVRCYGC